MASENQAPASELGDVPGISCNQSFLNPSAQVPMETILRPTSLSDLSQGHKAIFHQGKEQKFSKLKTVNFFQPLSQRKTPEGCDSEAPYLARLECSTLRFQAPQGKDSAPV